MNRIQKRKLFHNFSSIKGLKKKHTKGAFGRPSDHIMEARKKKVEKQANIKAEKNSKIVENPEKNTEK